MLFTLGMIISSLASLALIILGILVGVKILNKFGTGPGVAAILLAIFCNLATFIWGWVKAGELGIQKLMKWYTIALVVAIVGSVLYGIGMGQLAAKAASEGGFEGFEDMQNQLQEDMERAIKEAEEAAEAAAESAQ